MCDPWAATYLRWCRPREGLRESYGYQTSEGRPTGWGTPGSPGCWAEGLLLPTCVRHSCQAQWSYWGKGSEISNLVALKTLTSRWWFGTSKRGLRCLRRCRFLLEQPALRRQPKVRSPKCFLQNSSGTSMLWHHQFLSSSKLIPLHWHLAPHEGIAA